jgi:hypothetical protein
LKERGNFARKVQTIAIYLQKILFSFFLKFPTVYRWSPSWNMGYSLPPPPIPSPSPSFKGRGNGLYMGHFMVISMKIYPAEYSLSFTFCNIL